MKKSLWKRGVTHWLYTALSAILVLLLYVAFVPYKVISSILSVEQFAEWAVDCLDWFEEWRDTVRSKLRKDSAHNNVIKTCIRDVEKQRKLYKTDEWQHIHRFLVNNIK